MSHTYVSSLVHCVFSTKRRQKLIAKEIQPRLWEFIGGSARKNEFKALIVGGMEITRTFCCRFQPPCHWPRQCNFVKGASSHWMNEKHVKGFAWQEGYGAFTVGISQQADTVT